MGQDVVLLGKGNQACRIGDWFLANSNYELIYVVPVIPEPSWADSLASWCRTNNVPFVKSGLYSDIPGVDSEHWHVDLLFSVFYDRMLPEWMLGKSGRNLNLHNAPLPRYRGVAPINWALKNKESMHGVTIHEMTSRIDAGPIVAQALFSIHPGLDEVIDVYRRCLSFGYTLFEETMPRLDQIIPRPQCDSEAIYHSKRDRVLLGDRKDFTRSISS